MTTTWPMAPTGPPPTRRTPTATATRRTAPPRAAANARASRPTDQAAAGSGSSIARASLPRNAPDRQAANSAIETTATMIVEIALIWGETPNLIEL